MQNAGLFAQRSRTNVFRLQLLTWACGLLLLLAWFAATAPLAFANGSAVTEVFKGTQGPYQVVVRALSPRLVLGNAHFSIVVSEAASNRLVLDASVNVRAAGPEGAAAGPIETYREISTPQYYDVNIPLDTVGQWQFTVEVDGPMGAEEISFPLEVKEPAVNWGVVVGLLVLVLLALPLVIVGARSLRSRKRRSR